MSAIACRLPDGRTVTAKGSCEGVVADAPRGQGGFGYDPVFLVPSLGKTFAELSAEEKNQISHRGAALRAFAEKFREAVEPC